MPPRQLLYKVVELSTVDEHNLERTLNEWVPRGWTLDGVQFAMRESSKRPSMAFVFFTREGPPLEDVAADPGDESGIHQARERLRRLAGIGSGVIDPVPAASRPGPMQPEEGEQPLYPYQEFAPEHFERAAQAPAQDALELRTWSDRPERATDPWARLQALAGEDDGEPDP